MYCNSLRTYDLVGKEWTRYLVSGFERIDSKGGTKMKESKKVKGPFNLVK